MKSLLTASVFAVATALASGAALAAPPAATHSATQAKEFISHGVVANYSPATGHLTLKNGESFKLDQGAAPAALKIGDKVDIRWIARGEFRDANLVTLKK